MTKKAKKPEVIATLKLLKIKDYLFHRAKMRFSVASDREKAGDLFATKVIFGQTITLNLKDLDQRYLYEEHIREPENIFTYAALARYGVCDTFVDIGANYGHDAILLVNEFKKLLLIEPNPMAVSVLKQIFENKKNVEVLNVAIVGKDSPRELLLKVPKDSSALASLVDSPLMRDDIDTYNCKGKTLKECVGTNALGSAYIKIDVEGGEYAILSEAADEILEARAIVGFEALSRDFAIKCASLLKDYTFYYAKFDFLSESGSLTKSPFRLIAALIGIKASITLFKVNEHDFSKAPDNFSQVYCVPIEKVKQFEDAIKSLSIKVNQIDCSVFEY